MKENQTVETLKIILISLVVSILVNMIYSNSHKVQEKAGYEDAVLEYYQMQDSVYKSYVEKRLKEEKEKYYNINNK